MKPKLVKVYDLLHRRNKFFQLYILSKMFLYDQNFLINMSFKIQYFKNTESFENET